MTRRSTVGTPDHGHYSIPDAAKILGRGVGQVKRNMDRLGIKPEYAKIPPDKHVRSYIRAEDVEVLAALVPRHKASLKVEKPIKVRLEDAEIPESVKVTLLELQKAAAKAEGKRRSFGNILFQYGVRALVGNLGIEEVTKAYHDQENPPWKWWRYRPGNDANHRKGILPRVSWPRAVEIPEWAKQEVWR